LVNNQAEISAGPFRTYLVAPSGGVIPLDRQTPAGLAWMDWQPPDGKQPVTVDPEGQPAIGAFRWLPGKQAGVLVAAPRTELVARTEQLSNLLWAGLFLLALLGVIGLWRLGSRISEGLEELQQAARRAPQTDISLDAALAGPQELSEVAQAFQKMAQRVAHMQDNLMEQVRARTAALEASEERYRLLAELSPIPIGLHDQDNVLYANGAAVRLLRAPSAADLIGRPLDDLLHPEEIERARQILACLLERRPPPEPGRYRMRRWDGTEFLAELTVAPLHTEPTPLFQVILRPISGDQASAAIQQVFSRLAQNILADRTLEEQIWDLYEGCRRILPLDTFYLAIVDQENQTYTTPLFIQRGENLGAFTRPLDAESLTAYVVRTRQPLLIRDSSDPDQLPATPQRIAFPPEKLCYMAVPLLHGEEVLGVLSAQNFTVNAYGEEDVALLAQLGNQIALALVHARQMQAIRTQSMRMQRILDTAPGGLLMLDGAHRVVLANPDAWKLLERLGAFTEEGRLTHLAGQSIEELLPQATATGAPITLEQQEPAHLVVEVASRPLSLLNGDEGWVVSLHDVTRLWEQERRLQRQERLATVGQLAAGMAHDF
ncbi:MAG: PAS domain S-box protein, partial [Caldilineae bacterium]